MTSPHSTTQDFRQRLLASIARTATRTIAFTIRHTHPTERSNADVRTVGPPTSATPTFTMVDDPDGQVRLVGVRGVVDARAAALLAATIDAIDDVRALHIDLTAAEFVPERTIELIEQAFDRAERRGLRLRVVGLDPELPALLRRTPR